MVKLLVNQKQEIILSPKVFDILKTLLKSDEENATGDILLWCKMFSGERCSYHYSTEESWVTQANTPFSILRFTQLLNVAKPIANMDHGHGLVDRFLFPIPLALRSMLQKWRQQWANWKPRSSKTSISVSRTCTKMATAIHLQPQWKIPVWLRQRNFTVTYRQCHLSKKAALLTRSTLTARCRLKKGLN